MNHEKYVLASLFFSKFGNLLFDSHTTNSKVITQSMKEKLILKAKAFFSNHLIPRVLRMLNQGL